MYNSRPRKMSYESYPDGFTVPENYSGNAFRESIAETDYPIEESPSDTVVEEVVKEQVADVAQEAVEPAAKIFEEKHKRGGSLFSRSGFGFNIGNLFGGGIGFEELLIIGLIFLIAQSENNEDIIVLLALLLFIG